MLSFIIAIVLLLLALVALTLRKTYYYLPETELKRQARSGDGLAKTLYRAVGYGTNLRILLWALIGFLSASGLVLFVRIAPIIFGFVVVIVVLWLGFAWMPRTRLTSYGARIAVWFTPVVVWLLGRLNPVLSRLAIWWHRRYPPQAHTGIYERADLVRLIDQQRRQPDNRISAEILDVISNALSFDTRKVRDIVVPRKSVKGVGKDDAVGPILLDELHATGFGRFPVYDESADDIIGTLRLISLDEAKSGGHVRDFMDSTLAFVHESDSLADALHAVYQSKQQLLLVVNSFDEYVGIVTLEDLLRALLGRPDEQTFSAHHDRALVAAKHAKPKKSTTKPKSTSQTEETVIE